MKTNNGTHDARLLVLDAISASILSFDTEGNDVRTIIDKINGVPDGIAIDPVRKHIYWTNMGSYHEGEHFPKNDGSIERINFDGSGHTIIIPIGATFTPKQMQIDIVNGFIYWSDREGMRVMRSKLDGSEITTLVQTGEGEEDRKDVKRHCVGIAIDSEHGFIYWTQKGGPDAGEGRIFRAGLALPAGADATTREDIELLWEYLPEPIDLEIDHANGYLYWTDRGNLYSGNSVNRAKVIGRKVGEREVIISGLKEAIGLALDPADDTIYFGDLSGRLYRSSLDGFDHRVLYAGQKLFTGMAYVSRGLS